MRPLRDVARRGAGVGGKTGREALVERVAIVGIAVMAQVPDRQDRVAPLRLQEGIDVGEIVSAAAFVHERPGYAFPRDGDAELAQHAVILVGMDPVLRLLAQVAAALVLPLERRAFEAGEEEGREDAVALRHGSETRGAGLSASPSPDGEGN